MVLYFKVKKNDYEFIFLFKEVFVASMLLALQTNLLCTKRRSNYRISVTMFDHNIIDSKNVFKYVGCCEVVNQVSFPKTTAFWNCKSFVSSHAAQLLHNKKRFRQNDNDPAHFG